MRVSLCLLLLFAACAPPQRTASRRSPAEVHPNLLVTEYEVVQNIEEDGISALRIYIDRTPAGSTPSGRKSLEKTWGGYVPPGNHLMRFERWTLPWVGDWIPVEEAAQPHERFIRVEPGKRTHVVIKYFNRGKRYSYGISYEHLADRSAIDRR